MRPAIVRLTLASRLQGLLGALTTRQALSLLVAGFLFIALLFSLIYFFFGLITANPDFLTVYYFSIVTQATVSFGDLIPSANKFARFTVALHIIVGMLFYALSGAVLVFKFLHPTRKSVHFDPNVIFYPDEGRFRIRLVTQPPTHITNVSAKAYLRTWLDGDPQARYGTFDVPLRRELIPRLMPRDPWNLVSVDAQLPLRDAIDFDAPRKLLLGPNHLASAADTLTIVVAGDVEDLDTRISASATYTPQNVFCGRYEFIDPQGVTALRWQEMKWENWGRFRMTDKDKCPTCRFFSGCRLRPCITHFPITEATGR